MAPRELLSPELARHLCELSYETHRQLGVLINRRGEVEHVVVGDAFRLELPDVGRARAGDTRLRGLRLVHTHLDDTPLTRDDLTDLALLKLDLVCALEVRGDGLPGRVHAGYLAPERDDADRAGDRSHPWLTVSFDGPHLVTLDPLAVVEEVEAGFARVVRTRAVAREGRALLVGVALQGRTEAERSMAELRELARTAGVEVVEEVIQPRRELDRSFVVGEGKLGELNLLAMQRVVDLLIFDHDLSPSQARHLADRTSLKVIDRTQLILDIFAQRARSADGKLQVELAQLQYMLPRLGQRDDGLSRLSGGIGGRGPGETRLELDRRRVRDRIAMLERKIDQLSGERAMRRQKRGRGGVPVIGIVGYTNAGKSTLLNTLTEARVLAENKLFATLDPTSRRLRFPRDREVVLTDTVGFIRQLPKALVKAFRATLEELAEADLLLHVMDASDPDHEAQRDTVEAILSSLELDRTPRLRLYNKCDRLPGGLNGPAARALAAGADALAISAETGAGLPELLVRAEAILWREGRVAAPNGEPFAAAGRAGRALQAVDESI